MIKSCNQNQIDDKIIVKLNKYKNTFIFFASEADKMTPHT